MDAISTSEQHWYVAIKGQTIYQAKSYILVILQAKENIINHIKVSVQYVLHYTMQEKWYRYVGRQTCFIKLHACSTHLYISAVF